MDLLKNLFGSKGNVESRDGSEFGFYDFQISLESRKKQQENYLPSFSKSDFQQTYKRRCDIERKDFKKLLENFKSQVSEEVFNAIQSMDWMKDVPCSRFVHKKSSNDRGEFGMVFITYSENKKLNLTVVHFQAHTLINQNPTNENSFFELDFETQLCKDIIKNQCFIVLENEGLVEPSQKMLDESQESKENISVNEMSKTKNQASNGSNKGMCELGNGKNKPQDSRTTQNEIQQSTKNFNTERSQSKDPKNLNGSTQFAHHSKSNSENQQASYHGSNHKMNSSSVGNQSHNSQPAHSKSNPEN